MAPDNHPQRMPASTWLNHLEVPRTANDCLGRTAFARTLADAIVRLPDDRSVVTAVFGPWGSGKTWLLERITAALEQDHPTAIVICRFSPWELKSHEQILGEFFSTVRTKIPPGEDAPELAGLWKKLEQIAMVGSLGVGGVASAVLLGQGEFASSLPSLLSSFSSLFGEAAKSHQPDEGIEKQLTLAEVKDALATELTKKLIRPILIVIDDLDRLTHGEIQLMIRLLNTTANLPKLHYLIFGDRQQIASALNPVCGEQGDRYLEKLVQNSFQVPEPGENQIRLRLWDGIEKLAKGANIEASAFSTRFAEFWDAFLKFRLGNLRDCHRLLRTLDFHTGALTHDGVLEVDLMDLLGVDFLRVFDPGLYHRIASEIPTELWCFANLSPKPKDSDSRKALELIEASTLGSAIACGALISLFPHLSSHLKEFLEHNQLQALRYRRSREKPSPLGLGNVNRAEIYFRLDVAAGDLPEAKVKEFAATMEDATKMYGALKDFKARKWLRQLFGRLKSDPQLIKDGATAARVLLAVSIISDDLDYHSGPEDDELGDAYSLSDVLIERMGKDGAEADVLPAIRESGSCSLPLLLIEHMRDSSGCSFFPGSKAPMGLIKLTADEIDALADELLPEISRRFALNHFMTQDFDALRAYRMAHALGPERTEKVLSHPISGRLNDKVWRVIESVALSIMPSIDLNSWEKVSNEGAAGSVLLEHLLQFASISFWKSVLASETTAPATEFSKVLVPHLKLAIQQNEDGEA